MASERRPASTSGDELFLLAPVMRKVRLRTPIAISLMVHVWVVVGVSRIELPKRAVEVEMLSPSEAHKARQEAEQSARVEPAVSLDPVDRRLDKLRLDTPRKLPTPAKLAQTPAPKPPEPKVPEPPKPKPEEQPVTKAPLLPLPRLKMVEVNTPETKRPPDNARFLSDKDRRVEQETVARHTNLVKDHRNPEPYSRPNPDRRSPEPGAAKPKIAEDREQKAREARRRAAPAVAKRARTEQQVSPWLRMRGPAQPERRESPERSPDRAPGGLLPARLQATKPAGSTSARAAVPGTRGRSGPNLNLDHRSFDRIFGKDAENQRALARLSPSTPGGRWQKKWSRIRSALENFTPEVRPGNQTALGTRAHPFALYVARMHRKIHKLWGFGFLVDLDNKPDSNPLNRQELWAMIEVVIAPDGKVAKATVVRPSGLLTYDVAALDTVLTAGPYEATPRAIRSADGRVYLHWRFHRDHRQCGTFGVDPYILTKPPSGPIDSAAKEVGQSHGPRRVMRQLNRQGTSQVPPHSVTPQAPKASANARTGKPAAGAHVSSNDPGARAVATRFVAAFRDGQPASMARLCGVPFSTQGKVVARSTAALTQMLGDLLREARSRATSGPVLMTAMEARKQLGALPPGVDDGAQMLVGRARLGGTGVTLILQRDKGRWQIVGLNRD